MRPDASEAIFSGKQFDVVVEEWGGRKREIVRHPGSVAVVAVDREQRVVLVRQFREPTGRSLLELPAGTLEPGEDPLACARRELAEETGLTGGRWRQLATCWTSPGFLDEQMHLFAADELEPGEPALDDDEQIELVRIPVASLDDRLGQIEDAKTLAGLLLYLRDVRK